MDTITDFNIWLEQADPEDFEDVYCLYHAVKDKENYGLYECKKSKDGKLFIKADHTEETLMLASQKAIDAFLNLIERRYVDPGMEIEGWYEFHRAMAKND
ncbi:MAG: hypothetical protein PHW65_03675 [Dehalococcoidales bacterium]|nr:hypothetical protein [Dehalococcoidales bacterium]